MKEKFEQIKNEIMKFNNDNISINISENDIIITKYYYTKFISFSYTGIIKLLDIPVKNSYEKVSVIHFKYDQNDSGRYDTSCNIKNLYLIDRKKSELELYDIKGIKTETTKSIKTFMKCISDCL